MPQSISFRGRVIYCVMLMAVDGILPMIITTSYRRGPSRALGRYLSTTWVVSSAGVFPAHGLPSSKRKKYGFAVSVLHLEGGITLVCSHHCCIATTEDTLFSGSETCKIHRACLFQVREKTCKSTGKEWIAPTPVVGGACVWAQCGRAFSRKALDSGISPGFG